MLNDSSLPQNRREEVWIYDIKNSKWYIQETTGAGPYERMGGCAVVASAPDGKSHQVFLYGGGSGSRMFGMDDAAYMGIHQLFRHASGRAAPRLTMHRGLVCTPATLLRLVRL